MSRTTGCGTGPAPRAALGLPAASALAIGSVIGTGVFALPSALAPYGVTVGALVSAVAFGALSKRVSASGGHAVFVREAFGEFAGFLNAWSYGITRRVGRHAAIVVARLGHAEVAVAVPGQRQDAGGCTENRLHTIKAVLVAALED
ncbi:hypothetical protein ABZT06_20495 [Streptomyces sp. NPDC005483]|uniref:hypothetical protein n=1 Tax=Streptomyces sp. NPDC005483 TaxID=3154882 RepID=UPI00339E1780